MQQHYMDQSLSPKLRAELLLKVMCLEEKMAQVNCIFPIYNSFYDMEKNWTGNGMGNR